MLTSPWVSFDTSAPAFTTNARKDLLHVKAGIRWAEAFLGAKYPFPKSITDEYNQASDASDEWWEEPGLMARAVLIVAGKDEILIDSINEFGATLTRVKDKMRHSGRGCLEEVEILFAEGEAHDMPNMDLEIGCVEHGRQTQMIRSWFASHL